MALAAGMVADAGDAERDAWVKRVLGLSLRTPGGAGAEVAPGEAIRLSPVKLGKASLLWRGTWAKADTQLQALRQAVLAAMHGEDGPEPEDYAELEGNLDRIEAITERLNLGLADDLDDLRNAEPEKAAQPLDTVRRRLAEYDRFLNTDEWVALIDDNEFHPVTVQSSLLKAVAAIRGALDPVG